MRFSISGKRSRDISREAMLPRVHRARLTTYWFECPRSLSPGSQQAPLAEMSIRARISTYFFNELVTSVSTSWFSSRSKLVARCPRRLSAKRGDASSFRHSIWPKCVRSPRVNRYRSLATLLRLRMCHCQPEDGRGTQVRAGEEAYRIL